MFAFQTTLSSILALLLTFKLTLANHNIPLFGNTTLGYFYVEAYIGTPPQKQSLILDTGSHLTILPCDGCTRCKKDHLYRLFSPSRSMTFNKIDPTRSYFNWACSTPSIDGTCAFEQGYSEGSVYSGYFAIDNFMFENELNSDDKHSHQHIFGCAMVETNEFYRQKADGIIGIGVLTKDVYKNPPTILDTEIIEGRVEKETFAICFAHNGGFLSLGSMNHEQHVNTEAPVVVDCKSQNWDDQFHLNLTGVAVNSVPLELEHGKSGRDSRSSFLDSGTTYVYFGAVLYDSMKQVFNIFCRQKHSNCGYSSKYKTCFKFDRLQWQNNLQAFFAGFPVISFEFNGGQIVNWYPEDYLVKKDTDKHPYYCPGVKRLSNVILGATFMRNYDIYFNKVEKTITFTRANCGNSAEFSVYESERQKRNLRLRKSQNAQDLSSVSSVPVEGQIITLSGTEQSAANNSSILLQQPPLTKVKQDLADFERIENKTTNQTTYQRPPNSTYLLVYIIIFGFLISFLVILMIKFMM